MKFSVLLYFLFKKLKSKSARDSAFNEKLKEKDITILIKTEDGKRGRSFSLSGGDVSSQKGDCPKPDVALVWSDAATAFATMTSKDKDAAMNALSAGKLKLEGDGALALWFTGVVKELR